MTIRFALRGAALACATLFAGHAGGGGDAPPQLSAATGASLSSCTQLATAFQFANATITSAESVLSGALTWGGSAVDAHCLVKGGMYRRTSPQDGKSHAIGFEMRLANAWNGRFFHQATGGIDGTVSTALGGGGPMPTTALQQGLAVISSDAGHSGLWRRTPPTSAPPSRLRSAQPCLQRCWKDLCRGPQRRRDRIRPTREHEPYVLSFGRR
jgi:hypothetical protein